MKIHVYSYLIFFSVINKVSSRTSHFCVCVFFFKSLTLNANEALNNVNTSDYYIYVKVKLELGVCEAASIYNAGYAKPSSAFRMHPM